ncbi:hypothetical protein PG999_004404 [Apiospora kogelbergensis]|uniref:CFEM domain-containing protein n=1 Tax=Apiospora kogelbergensis TaxID=1337665 RepID=A0AAW0QZ58_9PEZI
MKFLSAIFLPILGLSVTGACAIGSSDYVADIPKCGLQCAIKLVPNSKCQSFVNSTCICSNTELRNAVTQCVTLSCSGLDAFEFGKVQYKACELPVRSRKLELWAFILVEIFTIICMLARFASRILLKTWDLDDYFFVPIFLFFVDETLYLIALPLIKVAILCFYLRIFPHQRFRVTVYVAIGFIVMSGSVFLALQIAQCIPLSLNWEGWKDLDTRQHKCLNVTLLTTIAGYFSIAQDGVVLFLPLPILLSMHMPLGQRLKACLIFSLGVFATAVSCIRILYIKKFQTSLNPTWDNTDPLIWTALEVNVAVLVPCVVPIRQLFAQIRIAPLDGSNLKKSKYVAHLDLSSPASCTTDVESQQPRIIQTTLSRDLSMLLKSPTFDVTTKKLSIGSESVYSCDEVEGLPSHPKPEDLLQTQKHGVVMAKEMGMEVESDFQEDMARTGDNSIGMYRSFHIEPCWASPTSVPDYQRPLAQQATTSGQAPLRQQLARQSDSSIKRSRKEAVQRLMQTKRRPDHRAPPPPPLPMPAYQLGWV